MEFDKFCNKYGLDVLLQSYNTSLDFVNISASVIF